MLGIRLAAVICAVFIQGMSFADAFISVVKNSNHSFTYPTRRSADVSKQQHPTLSAAPVMEDNILTTLQPTAFIVFAAIVLGVLSQNFINSMLQGDQGLSAFLKDGAGYNKSNFKLNTNEAEKEDPLPWLKLPSLDFVEVAGQDNNQEAEGMVIKKLELLKMKLQHQIEKGDDDNAKLTVAELNKLMSDYGFEYKEDT